MSVMQNLAARLSNLAPGVELVTLQSRQAIDQTTFIDYKVPRARRRLLTTEELLQLDSLMAKTTLIWEMWSDILAEQDAPAPKQDDQIIDGDNNVFVIVNPVKLTLNKQLYSCVCQSRVN